MNRKIIECVPNFSEGRDMSVIRQITDVIESVDGVKLLDVDPGFDTNRTVVTFAGDPDMVAEAAFLSVKKASEVIDMSLHHGKHPRMGATDVCPFIPVSGISMEETVVYARAVAQRIGNELGISVYCYEKAAFKKERMNLAACRSGEYEGLADKLSDPAWQPDFGPSVLNRRSGATAVGARDYLVAFNVNLNTTSVRRANAIAFDVREKGRPKREGDPLTGKIIKDKQGAAVMKRGSLKSVKAIGWYIEEYGIAQISMNITNISVTPVHIAFDGVCRKAEARGIRITGSELVGLIPLKSLLDAGRYFLEKQQRSKGVSDNELIKIAIISMGLNDLYEFLPEKKIIEYVMNEKGKNSLIDMSLTEFMNETASESPAPGGGSASAYIGALGIALGTMVANLSSHKRGWDDRWKEFSEWAEKGKDIQNRLLHLVDEDTLAYRGIIEASSLPKNSESEKHTRNEAIEDATKYATMVPLRIMETAFEGFEVIREMVDKGNPNSVTDAGVGAISVLSCIKGAFLNVKVNASALSDKDFAKSMLSEAEVIYTESVVKEAVILSAVNDRIKS